MPTAPAGPELNLPDMLETLCKNIQSYTKDIDLGLVHKGFEFAYKAHDGQLRSSGDPYFIHVYQVALILSELHMDPVTITAGLLHDVVEDVEWVTYEMIEKEFGSEIRNLVDGVTKIGRYKYVDKKVLQAENFRKLVLAVAADIRVIIIKLADRLHNMRTLQYVRPEKRGRIASETLNIYAPFANRLGISWIKIEMEDLSFQYLEPETYEEIKRKVVQQKDERERYIAQAIHIVQQQLEKAEVPGEIQGRAKHYYSIYMKMRRREVPFEEIQDLNAIRIITSSIKDCYAAVGVIHTLWRPVPGRFKDYIAMPKPNMYQSIHTTVMGPSARRLEIQIRSDEMHRVAEEGIAAHWLYKEGKTQDLDLFRSFNWLRRLLDMSEEVEDSVEFFTQAISNVLSDSVYVFTPKGDVRELPKGSTPVDFAYSIHTEIGNHCVGARVNGILVPLRYVLKTGDLLEVQTSKTQVPHADWLNFVQTQKAKNKISSFLKSQARQQQVDDGKALLQTELRKVRSDMATILRSPQFPEILNKLNLKEPDDLFVALVSGVITKDKVISRLTAAGIVVPPQAKEIEELESPESLAEIPADSSTEAVLVGGLDDVVSRLAKCCAPVYGDAIAGLVTRGRGITVHQKACPNVKLDGEESLRVIPVKWAAKTKSSTFRSKITIFGQDRRGLLADITETISNMNISIHFNRMGILKNGDARGEFLIEVADLSQLKRVIQALENLKGVTAVERI